jgi:hypothetical protein
MASGIAHLRLKQMEGILNGAFPISDAEVSKTIFEGAVWTATFVKNDGSLNPSALDEFMDSISELEVPEDSRKQAPSLHPLAWVGSLLNKKMPRKTMSAVIAQLWHTYGVYGTTNPTLWISEDYFVAEQKKGWSDSKPHAGKDLAAILRRLQREEYLEKLIVDGFHYYRPVETTTPGTLSMLGYYIAIALTSPTPPDISQRRLHEITASIRELLEKKILTSGEQAGSYHVMPGTWICQPGNHPVGHFQFEIYNNGNEVAEIIPDLLAILATKYENCKPYQTIQENIRIGQERHREATKRTQIIKEELTALEKQSQQLEHDLQELKSQLP